MVWHRIYVKRFRESKMIKFYNVQKCGILLHTVRKPKKTSHKWDIDISSDQHWKKTVDICFRPQVSGFRFQVFIFNKYIGTIYIYGSINTKHEKQIKEILNKKEQKQ